MPRSVVGTLRAASEIKCHELLGAIARNTTHLAWVGEPSPQLQLFIDSLGAAPFDR